MAIHLHIVYGCFHVATTRLNCYNRELWAWKAKNIYYLAFYKPSMLTTNLDKVLYKYMLCEPY